jgi:hypothetical protein
MIELEVLRHLSVSAIRDCSGGGTHASRLQSSCHHGEGPYFSESPMAERRSPSLTSYTDRRHIAFSSWLSRICNDDVDLGVLEQDSSVENCTDAKSGRTRVKALPSLADITPPRTLRTPGFPPDPSVCFPAFFAVLV